MLWCSEQEDEFKLALSLKAVSEKINSQSLFERSIPYLYLDASQTPQAALSHFVSEASLAALVQTPLGLVHQTLFSISATMADSLYRLAVLPILGHSLETNKKLNTPEKKENSLDALFIDAQEDLRKAFSSAEFFHTVSVWRRLEFRRLRLLAASTLCSNGVATFYKLAECYDTQLAYITTAEMLFPEFDVNELVPEAIFQAKQNSRSLSKATLNGYQIATLLANKCNSAKVVDLAALLASHVAYEECALLDCPDPEFEHFVSSLAMSADQRFACFAQNFPLLIHTIEKDDNGVEALKQLRSLIPSISKSSCMERSFSKWIHTKLMGSKLVRNALGDDIADLPDLPAIDTWCDTMMPAADTPLPILCNNGSIVGASEEQQVWIKVDLIIGERLHLMNKIYNLMAH